ncbi:MAG: 4-hydroxythreonine-4-phosphate dehydrogenase PdxA [Candidatus Hydrogenedens sp.]|nr:4-hydroxythreonine-4-phosphate dehydrogenase PdxA [Candidatus Hydrogenedens sp.]
MHTSRHKPTIGITLGDINGVGPEVTANTLTDPSLLDCAHFVVYGDFCALSDAMQLQDAPTRLVRELETPNEGAILVHECGQHPEAHRGVETESAAAAAYAWICEAAEDAIQGRIDGIVTAPVSKAAILRAGYHDMGHTELLARLTHTEAWRMCLFFDEKLVVHITGHLPLRAALDAVTTPRILESVRMANTALRSLGHAAPRIAVAGLNPHAGEQGALGREEIDIVAPAVALARAEGVHCVGPVPPDALFRQLMQDRYDGVVALYHDQGHIPVKMAAMERGVNVTLGLPIVRTSPDHGTAYDIAWTGVADPSSMKHAVRLAVRMAQGKNG